MQTLYEEGNKIKIVTMLNKIKIDTLDLNSIHRLKLCIIVDRIVFTTKKYLFL